jgi:hypothetical protein
MSVAAQAIPKAQLSWRLNTCRAFLALGVAAGLLLVAFPEIDLCIAQATFSPATGGSIGWRLGWLAVVRSAFIVFFLASIAVAIVGWLARRKGPFRRQGVVVPGGVSQRRAGLAGQRRLQGQLGPGTAQADRSVRRQQSFHPGAAANQPMQTQLLPCQRRSLFGVRAVLCHRRHRSAVGGDADLVGTAAGLSAGIVRIAQGAHFLSDVVFAGLFMGLLALALQRLMFAPRGSWPLVFKNRLHGRPVARTSAPSARACVSAKVTAAARLQVGALATSLRLTTGGPRASPDSSWPHHP